MENKDAAIHFIRNISGQQAILTVPKLYLEMLDGDIKTALFLSQIIYWSDKGHRKDGWFYKSDREWKDELCLSEYDCKKGRDKLTELGLLETEKKKAKGVPTLHYKMNWTNLSKWVSEKFSNRMSMGQNEDAVPEKFPNPFPNNSETHSGKTPEPYTKSTNKDYDKDIKDIKDVPSNIPKTNSLFDIPSKGSQTIPPLEVLKALKGKSKLKRKLQFVLENDIAPSDLDDLDLCYYYSLKHKELVGYDIPYQKENYMKQFRQRYGLTTEQAFHLIPSIAQTFRMICEQDARKKSDWNLKIGLLTFEAPSDISRIMDKVKPKVNEKYVQPEDDTPTQTGSNIVDEIF